VRRFEYRVIVADDHVEAQELLNKLAAHGFRVVTQAAVHGFNGNENCWTLEREVMPSDPYREAQPPETPGE
jgi:hypothetical protein